jgi:hypothetical protein
LLAENGAFAKGLHKLVSKVLVEKEEKAGHEADLWLSREATKKDAVKKAGTFRYMQSLM